MIKRIIGTLFTLLSIAVVVFAILNYNNFKSMVFEHDLYEMLFVHNNAEESEAQNSEEQNIEEQNIEEQEGEASEATTESVDTLQVAATDEIAPEAQDTTL